MSAKQEIRFLMTASILAIIGGWLAGFLIPT